MSGKLGFERLAELERSGESFVLATVVGRRAPVSANLGDRAVIFADGRMEGFVGGACARDIVRGHALEALRLGRAQLVAIRPANLRDGSREAGAGDGSPEASHGYADVERVVVPMGCASEGAIEVYIEPHVPRRELLVVGFTPVAEAVARLAAALDYAVIRCVAGSEISELQTPAGATVLALEELGAFLSREAGGVTSLSAIVASQGHYDEIALEALLEYPVGYVGVLASRKRMESIRGVLAQSGFAAERLAHVRNPIGLDIGARTPSEIALAILAEIVSLAQPAGWGEVDSASDGDARASASPSHRAESPHVHESVASHDRDATRAIDPVCGMSVEREGALHRFELGDRTVYFCCDGCKRSFAREPERFSVSLERT